MIGVYGVAAHSVAQRTKEIGIRLAIGGTASAVRGMLLRESLVPLAAGLVLGAGGAFALGQYVSTLIQAAERPDVSIAGSASAALVGICALAVWRATARVVRIDPMQALRVD